MIIPYRWQNPQDLTQTQTQNKQAVWVVYPGGPPAQLQATVRYQKHRTDCQNLANSSFPCSSTFLSVSSAFPACWKLLHFYFCPVVLTCFPSSHPEHINLRHTLWANGQRHLDSLRPRGGWGNVFSKEREAHWGNTQTAGAAKPNSKDHEK